MNQIHINLMFVGVKVQAEFRQQYVRARAELKNKSIGNQKPVSTRVRTDGKTTRGACRDDWKRDRFAAWRDVGPPGQTAGGPRSFTESVLWRKGWDSNPRWSFPHGGFQDRCLKPLGHPSMAIMRYITFGFRARVEVYGNGVNR